MQISGNLKVFPILHPEVLPGVGLPELPIGGRHVDRGRGAAVAADDSEGECLADEVRVGLPVLSPIPAHCHPLRVRSLDEHALDVAGPGDVRY